MAMSKGRHRWMDVWLPRTDGTALSDRWAALRRRYKLQVESEIKEITRNFRITAHREGQSI